MQTTTSPTLFVHDTGILSGMDATAIAENIRLKKISVKEAVECVQQRAEKVNPTLNAIVTADYQLNQNTYNPKGFFAGVPMFIKDASRITGFPTGFGTRTFTPKIETKNDKYMESVHSAGFVFVGKSTLSEFGLLPSVEAMKQGNTLNPHNIDYSTGGSSGGAASLVASGVVPMAHGRDGGGSIRIPAACCGLIGLKPSRFRQNWSTSAALPIDIAADGVLTRTVRDTANYIKALEDFHQSPKLKPVGHVTGPGKERLKIALFTQSPAGIESHPEVCEVIMKAGKACESLGHHVEYIPNPFDDVILFDFLVYYCFIGRLIRTMGRVLYDRRFDASKLEPFTKGLSEYAVKFLPMFPGAMRRLRKDIVNQYNDIVQKYDVLLSPTLQGTVPKLQHYGPEERFISLVMRMNNYVTFTTMQNATGAPAISLPMGFCGNGLPVGVQFASALGEERKLLELAFELEEAGGLELGR